jgi:hypothetical protein
MLLKSLFEILGKTNIEIAIFRTLQNVCIIHESSNRLTGQGGRRDCYFFSPSADPRGIGSAFHRAGTAEKEKTQPYGQILNYPRQHNISHKVKSLIPYTISIFWEAIAFFIWPSRPNKMSASVCVRLQLILKTRNLLQDTGRGND